MEIKLESKRFVEHVEEPEFYTEQGMEEYVENDEMDVSEQGFMQGYLETR